MNTLIMAAALTGVFGGVVVWLGLGLRNIFAANITITLGMALIVVSAIFAAGLT